jgi:hypothetical protein
MLRTWSRQRRERLFGGASGSRPARRQPPSARPSVEALEARLAPTVNVLSNFDGLVSGSPPDTCGAVGPNSYVETINASVAIFGKNGTSTARDTLSHFLFTVGGITPTDAHSFLGDATSCYDQVTGQFIVGDLDVDIATAKSSFDFAVSKTSNPTTLTTADWTFYQIATTETTAAGTGLWSDYPGNIGYNRDAVVLTWNMFDSRLNSGGHVRVDAISQSSLSAGNGLTRTSFDLNGFGLRPATMHDSVPGGPMWLVSEGGDNKSINLTRIDNILSTHTTTTFTRGVNAYGSVNAPKNPDGSAITGTIDARILKAAEAHNTLVACQHVGVGTTEDDVRWYSFNVSNGTNPSLVDQGNVSAGNNTYLVYPAIDINFAGDIALSYIRSGTDRATDFMSVYVTGRSPADAAGTMQAPVLVKAGDSNNTNGREGDFSGINVDADGSFWAANEFTKAGGAATEVAHFTIVGQPPVAADLSYDVAGGSTLIVGVANGLVDQNGDTGGVAHFAGWVPGSPALARALTLNADGSFTFAAPRGTPNEVATFRYYITNPDGTSSIALVDIIIHGLGIVPPPGKFPPQPPSPRHVG